MNYKPIILSLILTVATYTSAHSSITLSYEDLTLNKKTTVYTILNQPCVGMPIKFIQGGKEHKYIVTDISTHKQTARHSLCGASLDLAIMNILKAANLNEGLYINFNPTGALSVQAF